MAGKHLKVSSMGTDVLGVRLEGNPKKPEPTHFRVAFPGGDLEVTRTTVGDYWVHVRVNKAGDAHGPHEHVASLTDARLDLADRHAGDVDMGDFDDPNLYHLAVRVTLDKPIK